MILIRPLAPATSLREGQKPGQVEKRVPEWYRSGWLEG